MNIGLKGLKMKNTVFDRSVGAAIINMKIY